MTTAKILVLAALAGSLALVFQVRPRVVAAIALAASLVEVGFVFGFVRISIKGVNLGLALAIALAAGGLIAWLKSTTRPAVTAASVVTVIGAIQLLNIWL